MYHIIFSVLFVTFCVCSVTCSCHVDKLQDFFLHTYRFSIIKKHNTCTMFKCLYHEAIYKILYVKYDNYTQNSVHMNFSTNVFNYLVSEGNLVINIIIIAILYTIIIIIRGRPELSIFLFVC